MWQGVQFFMLQIWTEISHSLGLQKSTTYWRDPIARTCSLDMWQPEMCMTYLKFRKAIFKAGFPSNRQVWNFNTEISIGKCVVASKYGDITSREMVYDVLRGLPDSAKENYRKTW